MSALLSDSPQITSSAVRGARLAVGLGLAFWLVLISYLGARDAFVAPLGGLPFTLMIALSAPLIAFLAAIGSSRPFHDLVLGTDVRFITAIQSWRIGGFSFLALYGYGILPGYFAWPAGLGDVAIGVTAPWLVIALMRTPRLLSSKSFAAWNVFGILDLIIAVSLGAFGRFLFADVSAAAMTAPMSEMPLVLVPAFFVPLFIILHLAALSQARHLAGEKRS